MPSGAAVRSFPTARRRPVSINMTRSLAVAWGRRFDSTACRSVGRDEQWGLLLPENREQWTTTIERIPVGRMGTVDDIGGICTFLASDAASYLNGTTIWADGGGT